MIFLHKKFTRKYGFTRKNDDTQKLNFFTRKKTKFGRFWIYTQKIIYTNFCKKNHHANACKKRRVKKFGFLRVN